jgi:non-specific serine/threonine protein kinase/serine/threonine-protein kinase
MEPERWQKVERLYHCALQCEESQRSSFLQQACATDETLRGEVESLLKYAHRPAEYFETPALEVVARSLADDLRAQDCNRTDKMIGAKIAQYLIVEKLGAGGMGEVYRAFRADDQYRKEVAFKVVRAGQDSSFVVSRFKNERQILASLDHPNIARLYDGGTSEDGVPYFVMELIDGQRIDQYCDHQKLIVTERLKVFLQICSAVQYAHQRLIIHRDIKPSNILVTSDGIPKLLDFGIAKILSTEAVTGQSEPTLSLFRLLTPEYASPEQIKGQPVTTASDVYSLGVVLYELLTGRHPFRRRNSTPQEMVHAVCEVEPERPSTAVRPGETEAVRRDSQGSFAVLKLLRSSAEKQSTRLRGDLDNIVLMALRKEPERRYASVEQFAEDIRRHLEGFPVVARKDSVGYRTSKFIARHKAGVMAATVVMVILLVAMAITARQARIARQQAELASTQRARAERRFNDVRALANALLFEIHDSIRDLPGSTPARKLLVDRALQYLDSLSNEGGGDPSLMRELASAYERVGDVQGYSYRPNLGDSAGAMRSYQKALAIRQTLAQVSTQDKAGQSDLAGSYEKIGDVLFTTGQTAKALETLRESLTIWQKLVASEPSSERAGSRLANCHGLVGDVLFDSKDWAGALEEYENELSGYKSVSAAYPNKVAYRRMIALSIGKIAGVFEATGKLEQAQQEFSKSVGLLEVLVTADPSNALLRRNLSFNRFAMGETMIKLGDSRGIKELLEAASIDESLSAADPADRRIGRDLAMIYGSLGDAEKKTGETELALRYYGKALAIAETRSAADRQDQDARVMLSRRYCELGELYQGMAGDANNAASERRVLWQNARAWFQKCLKLSLNRKEPTALPSSDVQRIEELKRDIAKCDAALVKLRISEATEMN